MNTVAQPIEGLSWWRPQKAASPVQARLDGSPLAFQALVAFTFVLLLSPQAWFPALKVIRIALLAAGVAIVAHVSERTVHKQPVMPMAPEIGIALALVCWSAITIPMSYWPGGGIRLLTEQYIKAIVFFWLLATTITTPARIRGITWALVLCAIPLAATGLWHYMSGDVMSTGVEGLVRIVGYQGSSGLTGNPNDLALMLNLVIPLAGVLALECAGLRRLVAIGSLLLSMMAVVVTFSRAGFLTLAATCIMSAVVLARRKSGLAAVVLLTAALSVPALLPKAYIDRLSTITNIGEDKTGSAQGRYEDLYVAAEVVARNPIVGVGIGQDMIALNEARGRSTWRSVHNAYLQYAVDLGIPGFLLFGWLHLLCFRSARAVERRAAGDPAFRELALFAAGVQVSLIAFFVAALFHPIAYQFYFFSIGGIAVALKNTCRAEVARARTLA